MSGKQRRSSTTTAGDSGDSSASRLSRVRLGRQETAVKLMDVKPEDMIRLMDAMINAGCLISMSRTSDGGAIRVYVRDGAEEEKWYAANPLALQSVLMELVAVYCE